MLNTVLEITKDFWQVLSDMGVYLLFGFLVAGILSVLIRQQIVERHLGGRGLLPPLKAAILGMPLPLCSCGVIPVSMSLFRHGASRGSAIAFLLSTPQTGVDSMLVTLSLLGPVLAVFRPLAAMATGLIGGTVVDVFDRAPKMPSASVKCTEECCAEGGGKRKVLRALKYGFVTLPRDIGPSLFAGVLLAGVISVIVPEGFFAEKIGTGIFSKLVMMVMGIPVYVCATASVPVAAALMVKGVTPGAAVVFLMTGPATNAASLVTIWKTLGRRTAVIYILTVAGCAMAAGMFLDTFLPEAGTAAAEAAHRMLPSPLKTAAAVVLLALLIFSLVTRKTAEKERDS